MAHNKPAAKANNSITIDGVIDNSTPALAPPKDNSPVSRKPPVTLVNPEISHPTGLPGAKSMEDRIALPTSLGAARADESRASLETPVEPAWTHVVTPDGVHLQIHPEDLDEAMSRMPGLTEVYSG